MLFFVQPVHVDRVHMKLSAIVFLVFELYLIGLVLHDRLMVLVTMFSDLSLEILFFIIPSISTST